MTRFAVPTVLAIAAALFGCSSAPAPAGSGGTQPVSSAPDGGSKGGNNNTPSQPSGGDVPTPGGDAEGPPAEGIYPEEAFSGFAPGASKFRTYFVTSLETDDVKFEVADPTMADVAIIPRPFNESGTWAIATAKKSGDTKVVATGGGKRFEAVLHLTAYTADQLTLGTTRYKTGEGAAERRPCASCHEKANGADHSPSWMEDLPDDVILQAIQTAKYSTPFEYELSLPTHKWNLTDAEKPAIMAYLRALPPKGLQLPQ